MQHSSRKRVHGCAVRVHEPEDAFIMGRYGPCLSGEENLECIWAEHIDSVQELRNM
jgi:hypothetical protein